MFTRGFPAFHIIRATSINYFNSSLLGYCSLKLAMPPKGKKAGSVKDWLKSSKSEEKDDAEIEEKRSSKRKAEPVENKAKVAKTDETKPELKDLNFECDKTTKEGKNWNFKISSWNVAGLRAWIKKNGMDFIKKEEPDILCLQEVKCSEKKLPPEVKITGYHTYWNSAEKEGYSGVAVYSKQKPISINYGIDIKEHDTEGRVITAEYEKFYLVNVYVPNAGAGLKTLPKRMSWNTAFQNYLMNIDKKKPVILCGDLNVAHNEIDLANPKTNTKHAGFTQEERDGMTELLSKGFVDTYRHLYPETTGAYTFWSYMGNARSRNTGWRLDYFVLSERLMPSVCDNVIRNKVYGSDHCPITLFLHI